MGASRSSTSPLSRSPQGRRCVGDIDVCINETPTEAIVRIAGEASIERVDHLAARMLYLYARKPRLVTLDLSGLSCISALAMGALVRFRHAIVRAGGRVRLVRRLQESVRDSLVRAELLTLFD